MLVFGVCLAKVKGEKRVGNITKILELPEKNKEIRKVTRKSFIDFGGGGTFNDEGSMRGPPLLFLLPGPKGPS